MSRRPLTAAEGQRQCMSMRHAEKHSVDTVASCDCTNMWRLLHAPDDLMAASVMSCCRGICEVEHRKHVSKQHRSAEVILRVHLSSMAARSASIALRGVTSLARSVQRPSVCRSVLQSSNRCVRFQRVAAALAIVGSPFVSYAGAQGTCRALSSSVQCMAAATMEAPGQASSADNPLLQVLTCSAPLRSSAMMCCKVCTSEDTNGHAPKWVLPHACRCCAGHVDRASTPRLDIRAVL